MSTSIASISRTRLIGGDVGQRFNDFEKMMKNGKLVLSNDTPIVKLQVRTGWVVDQIVTTYKMTDGSTVACPHGSKAAGAESSTDLSGSESVISIFGRAGYQDYYKSKQINMIGFVIFDKSTCKTRTFGPFGNGNNSNNGEPFYTGAPMALGGYAQGADSPQIGLSGLWFYERTGGSLYLLPVQLPEAIRSGKFNSMEVREWQTPTLDSKKTIKLEPAHVSGPRPLIVYGLNFLDVDHKTNVRARGVVEQSASTFNESFAANIQSWSDSKIYAGGIGWLDVPVARGIQGGVVPHQWTIREASSDPFLLSNVRFETVYAKPPTVLVWLTGIDMASTANWRLKAIATEVTESGFNLSVQTWSDSKLYGAGASWLAVPSDDKDIVVGKYTSSQATQSGEAKFGRTLSDTPRVIAAFSLLDFEKGRNMRVNAEIESVTKDGLKWKTSTWGDSHMHAADTAFIAIAGQ